MLTTNFYSLFQNSKLITAISSKLKDLVHKLFVWIVCFPLMDGENCKKNIIINNGHEMSPKLIDPMNWMILDASAVPLENYK